MAADKMSMVCTRRTLAAAILAISVWHQPSPAQQPADSRVIIPFLANAARPAALEFEGAECERSASGNRMECTFQQVFLTTSALAPDTCLVTTNRYARTFDREAADRWVSTEGPEGVCGVLDVATLHDGGDGKWTMEMRKVATKKDAGSTCETVAPEAETLSWQNIRRQLPCRFVQPGGLAW